MSLSVDYTVYRKEVINFLQTVSIKFDLFAEQSQYKAESNARTIHLSDLDGRNNPYYLNLAGQYSGLDDPIYIIPVEEPYLLDDDGKQILDKDNQPIENKVILSRETLEKYPKTASIYKIPNIEYENLLAKHKGKEGLIKSIIYPAKDLDTVINARNLTVLAYDDSLLEEDEKDSLILAMTNFLDYIHDRWYVHDFKYEPAYAITFMGMIWNMLPSVLLTQRIRNLRTAQVHSMHIWEYLDSKGLGEYKAILTRKQAVFLYRNIDYLIHNKGKKTNLVILAENLLQDLYLTLVGKSVLQETNTANNPESSGYGSCITYPEFVNDEVTGNLSLEVLDEDKKQSMNEILYKMYLEGYYPDYLQDGNIEKMEEKFGLSTQNYLPTRLLEFVKDTINTSELCFLTEFLVDSLMYNWSKGTLVYRLKFLDKNVQQELNLSIGDAIALLYYAHHRAFGDDPVYLPTRYTSRICYPTIKPRSLPKTYTFHEFEYNIESIINTKSILSDINFDNGPYIIQDKFMVMLANQFSALSKHNSQIKNNVNTIYQRAMEYFYSFLTVRETFDLSLSQYANYKSWIAGTNGIAEFIEEYNKLDNIQDRYQELCDTLWNLLLPVENMSIFDDFTGGEKDNTYIYQGLKNLFTQLCSYRLFFLETDRKRASFISPPSDSLHVYKSIEQDQFGIAFYTDKVKHTYKELNDCKVNLFVELEDDGYNETNHHKLDITPTENIDNYEDRNTNTLYLGASIGISKNTVDRNVTKLNVGLSSIVLSPAN